MLFLKLTKINKIVNKNYKEKKIQFEDFNMKIPAAMTNGVAPDLKALLTLAPLLIRYSTI